MQKVSSSRPGQVGQFLLGFNPGNEATHQQQNKDTATESQEGGLVQNSNQEDVQQMVQQCMNRVISRDGSVCSKCIGAMISGPYQAHIRTKAPWPANPLADVISQMEPPGQRQGPQRPGMDCPTNLDQVVGE